MFFNIIVFLLSFSVCFGKYTNCGSKDNAFVGVDVTSCSDEDEKCLLKVNSTIEIKITFANVEANAIKAKVCGRGPGLLWFVCVPYSIGSPKDDGCKNGVICPVHRSQTETYTIPLDIPSKHLGVAGVSEWTLYDEKDKNIVCVSIPFEIVK